MAILKSGWSKPCICKCTDRNIRLPECIVYTVILYEAVVLYDAILRLLRSVQMTVTMSFKDSKINTSWNIYSIYYSMLFTFFGHATLRNSGILKKWDILIQLQDLKFNIYHIYQTLNLVIVELIHLTLIDDPSCVEYLHLDHPINWNIIIILIVYPVVFNADHHPY